MGTDRKAAGLRRSVLAGKSRRREGKGGWRGNWKDRLDIPKAEETDILLTRGEYPNPEDKDEKTGEPGLAHFHTSKQHGVKLKNSGPGSYFTTRCAMDAGLDDCVACMRMEQGDRRITLKDTFSFNCLHLALYERVPVVRDGKVVKYDEGEKRGEPVLTWAEVEKPRRKKEMLDEIDTLLERGEAALFRKKYIEVGAGHRDELSQIDEMASHHCKCGGELTPVTFTCEECGAVLADVERDDLSRKEISAFSSSRERCKECGHVGLPLPEMVCDSCKEPAPLTAFDVVATVRKEGEGTNSHIVVKKITPLDKYRLPNGAPLVEFVNVAKKGAAPEYEAKFDKDDNFVFTEEFDVKKLVEAQFDFEEVHKPQDHGYVANRLGCENPFPSTSGAGKYKNYGGGGGGGVGRRNRVEDEAPARGRGDDEEEANPRGRGREDDTQPGRRRRVGR